jgi:hypothetical protein
MFGMSSYRTMEMPRVGQAYIVANLENNVWEENAVCKGRCWFTTIHSILVELNMNIGSMHAIIRGLWYHKVHSHIYWWIHTRNITCQWYCTEILAFLWWIVVGKDTKCHCFIPTAGQAGMHWRHSTLPWLVKLKLEAATGKVKLSVFLTLREAPATRFQMM